MRTRVLAATAAVVVALLAGCAAPAEGDETPETPAPEPAATGTPSPTAGAGPAVFRMPDTCDDLLSDTTQSELTGAGLALLGGPGEPYFADPTPEERVGGITCIWGDEAVAGSTVIVSVAPVTAASRSDIVGDLIAQGLNESVVDGAVTYAQLGDEVSAPAVLNVVRDESWISVIEALGGEDRFQRATELVDEITERVYVPA